MRTRFLSSYFLVSGAALLIFGGCSDWSSLYGKDCGGSVVAYGEECLAGQSSVSSGGVTGLGGDGGGSGAELGQLTCGNGVVDSGEVCDDGNTQGDDSCLAGCSWATCGDGFQRRGVEDCDDGNRDYGDGCSDSCLVCGQPGSYFRPGTGHCYVRHEEEVSFDEARAVCAAEGAYLVVANSSTEAGILRRRFGNDSQEFWLGLRLEAGQVSWISGEGTGNLPWVNGEPTDLGCAVQYGTDARDDNFRAVACDEKRQFLCEQEPARTDPTTHHAYRRWFIETDQEGAMAFCASAGGALVSLESEEEREFLFNRIESDFWTAGHRLTSEGYTWARDGSLVSPEALAEAADTSADNDCLFQSGGELLAGPCSTAMAFVCEFF